MPHEILAQKAEAARAALIELAAAGAKVPKLKLNLLRSIELLNTLAERARSSETQLDASAEAEIIARALPAGLVITPGALSDIKKPEADAGGAAAEVKEPQTPEEVKKALISALAKEHGAKGGSKRTPAQQATATANFATAAKKRADAKRALGEARGQQGGISRQK